MTTFFNEQPYFDDFNEDKNFMRVLFKPGYAVQSRELTQLQTILANQIEKFGNHIFKSGSPVTGGKISLDDKANYIVLNKQYEGIDIVPEDFVNQEVEIINDVNKSVRAKVIGLDTQTEVDGSPILVLYYLTGDKFSEGDELRIKGQNIFAELRGSNAVGRSYVASIQEGIYYFKGYFVKIVPQFLVLTTKHVSGYNSTTILENPTYKVGIEFDENLINYEDDNTLLDPAQESFNYQAPGADRFQVKSVLSKREITSPDLSNFFEIVRVVDGKKTKEVEYPIYSEIEKTLARRTFDESGNYTVDPFVLSLEEGSVSNKFNVVLDPGKAYIQGFEFQTTSSTEIPVDRARTSENVSSFSISTNYSSYVVLNNITGVLDIEDYPQLDLHCVPVANVNTTTQTAYNSTKVGTLRVSNMDYNDATTSDLGNTHSFVLNVFEANNTPITGTLRGNAPSIHSNTTIILPAGFSSNLSTNAFSNAYFRITDGAGLTVGPLLILSSNATTINIESGLTFTPNANTFVIDSDVKIVKSMVRNVSSSIVFSGDVDSDSKDNGLTFIKEPLKDQLFFTLPYQAIKETTISDLDFFVKKVYNPSVSSSSPTVGRITITAEGTDTFAFSNGGTLSDVTILDNIICFIKPTSVANTTSGIYPGKVLSLANNYFTVTSPDSTTIYVDLNTALVDASFIITTKINNAETTTRNLRRKQLLPLNTYFHSLVPYELDSVSGTPGIDIHYAHTSANRVAVSNVGIVFVDSTNANSNNDIASTYFDNNIILQDLRTPGKAVSLQVSDVYKIIRITDSKSLTSNVTTSMLTNSEYDVTSRYDFNNGQKPTHYDHATIKLKRGAAPPSGKVYVQYEYFKHFSPSGDTEGLFTVDSYLQTDSNFTYGNIPKTFDSRRNELVSSRSILDFRPTREVGSSNLSGSLNVDPNREATLDYSYYTSRIDQIVIKPSKEFFIVKGSPAITPSPTPIQEGDMLIYSLFIPAYTSSVKDINVKFYDNRRFTMKDVGDIQERVKNLEYYVSLDSLEKETASLKILDANGLERSKYGFFVDNFKTILTQATNTELNNEDYNRNLVEDEELRPASLKKTVNMLFGGLSGLGNFKLNGSSEYGTITCNYTETFLNNSTPLQPYATKTQAVAGALFAKFNGRGRLYPDSDASSDISYLPAVNVNPVNGIDEAFKFINNSLDFINTNVLKPWQFDRNNPLARIPDRAPITRTNEERNIIDAIGSGFFEETITTTTTYLPAGTNLSQRRIQVGNPSSQETQVVTDVSITPWIKPSPVVFNSKGLRSNTTFYHFFEGTNVDKNIICSNKYALENTDGSAISDEILLKEGDSVIVANSTTEITNRRNLIGTTGITSGWDFLWKVTSVDNVNKIIYLVNEYSAAGNVENYVVNSTTNRYIASLPAQFSTANTASSYRINSIIEHKSGLTRSYSNVSSEIKLAADAPSVDITGNTINLIHNFKIKPASNSDFVISTKKYTITSYNTSTKIVTCDTDIDSSLRIGTQTGGITYSIGNNKTDMTGEISGLFLLDSASFRTGQRTFRVTESFNNTYDSDAISFADSQYLSNSLEVKKTPLIFSTYNVGVGTQTEALSRDFVLEERVNRTRTFVRTTPIDPLAQTFIVDKQNYPDGVFLSSVNLFFKNKDSGSVPVSIEIRPTVNGTPHASFWYSESVVSKQPDQVNISDNPSFDDVSTITTFSFDTPLYLKPGFYALVIKTDSPEYTVWVAEKGSVTTTGALVGPQPYEGTLYKSQNSMEYTPIINEDLMFDIKRCKFVTSTVGTVYFGNDILDNQANVSSTTLQALYKLPVDAFRFNQNIIVPNESKTSASYSFISTPYGGVKETSYRNISPLIKYFCGEDTFYEVGNRRKQIGAYNDFIVRSQLSTSDDRISPVLALTGCSLDVFENFINNAELQFTSERQDLVIVSSGSGYSNSNTVTISSTTGENFLANVVVESAANGNVVSLNVTSNGSGYVDDFVAVYKDTSWANGITSNVSIVATSEFSSSGGPCLARYITKKVKLVEGFDAGDLKVLLDANLPEGTEIHVYYKVLSSDDKTPFSEKRYGKMVLASELPPPAINRKDFVELEYRPTLNDGFLNYTGNNGVTYDTFREFSIKITMTSSDPSVIPRIKNLRVIAMPGE